MPALGHFPGNDIPGSIDIPRTIGVGQATRRATCLNACSVAR